MKKYKFDIFLIFILIAISIIFRVIKLNDFQYWSDDEQLLFYTLRHIVVDHHSSLVTPNVALELSMGPIFHYLLIPWYLLVDFKPDRILLFGIFFSSISVILMYITGFILGGRLVAITATLLYSTSFMSSLFDRRLWHLSPNVILILLSLFSVLKIVKGDSKYILPLTLSAIFSFNSDPSIGIIVISAFLIFIIYRPKIKKIYLLSSFIFFVFAISPLIIFDIRHQGQNLESVLNLITRISSTTNQKVTNDQNIITEQVDNIARFFYVYPTNVADAYFCYCLFNDRKNSILNLAVYLIFLFFIIYAVKEKKRNYFILIIFLFFYILGLQIFEYKLNGLAKFSYSVTISPIAFIVAAIIFSRLKGILYIILPIFFILNFNTLVNSSFKYPLKDKLIMVNKTTKQLPENTNFSLYYSGDILLAGGGWNSLFTQRGFSPKKGSLTIHWGHIYNSYNLYGVNFTHQEPETIVVISEKNLDQENMIIRQNLKNQDTVGKVHSFVLNNNLGEINYLNIVEDLYQPDYFLIK